MFSSFGVIGIPGSPLGEKVLHRNLRFIGKKNILRRLAKELGYPDCCPAAHILLLGFRKANRHIAAPHGLRKVCLRQPVPRSQFTQTVHIITSSPSLSQKSAQHARGSIRIYTGTFKIACSWEGLKP
jgi:hypothetical protein